MTKQVITKYDKINTSYGKIKLQYEDGGLTDSKVDLFHSAINSLYMISITDHNGVIIHTNEAFSRLSGYSVNEIIGTSHRVLNSGHLTQTHQSR